MRITEEQIRESFTNAAPDDFSALRRELEAGGTPSISVKKGTSVNMKRSAAPTKLSRRLRGVMSMAAALVLFLGAGLGVTAVRSANKVDSVISLDVNPSIEITANKKERVLAVTPLNEEGKIVIGTMDFKHSSLDVCVNALIGSMLRNGYLSAAKNSILVTVDNKDAEKEQALEDRITAEISALISGESFSGAVLSQAAVEDESVKTLAEQYGITAGKAQLIREISDANPRYSFEELVPLTINEINLITGSDTAALDNVRTTGAASDTGYIGEKKALAAALQHAGITEDVSRYECELEYERGVMVYELEFRAGNDPVKEYEYDIDALTGEVVKSSVEEKGAKKEKTAVSGSASYIPEDEAKRIALAHAGVAEKDIFGYTCKLDKENGTVVYEIEFKTKSGSVTEYEYDINATTGEVVKSSVEENGKTKEEKKTASGSASYISEDEAKRIALAHAGVAEKDIFGYTCKLDKENGTVVYEIEFKTKGESVTEYEYDINALTGEIVKSSTEENGKKREEKKTVSGSGSLISEDEAKRIALAHAKLSAGEVSRLRIEREKERGVTVYDIEFRCGGYEYSYEINAETGAIIEWEKEKDD